MVPIGIGRSLAQKARLPKLRVYDLRRSAVRNLTHAGVAQATTMKISGHRTADTFRRYMIEDAEDTANAFRRVADYVRRQKKRRKKLEDPEADTDNSRTTGKKSEDS